MDEEKIKKLNSINNDVKTAKHICDALKNIIEIINIQ